MEVIMVIEHLRRCLVAVVCISLVGAAMPMPAQAAIVSTDRAISLEQRAGYISAVTAGLAREDLQARFVALGVDPAQVQARLAGLTDSELAALAGRIDELPAGGDALAIIGIVFLVLLLLEFTGTIDIFKKVP